MLCVCESRRGPHGLRESQDHCITVPLKSTGVSQKTYFPSAMFCFESHKMIMTKTPGTKVPQVHVVVSVLDSQMNFRYKDVRQIYTYVPFLIVW